MGQEILHSRWTYSRNTISLLIERKQNMFLLLYASMEDRNAGPVPRAG